jgi:hypothetical protein
LRRGWTKFSLCTSIALVPLLASIQASPQANQSSQRVNELTLAGLRPGRDTMKLAFKRYNAKFSGNAGKENAGLWQDTCTERTLRIEADGGSLIQTITVSSLLPQDRRCGAKGAVNLPVQEWVTGHGLRIGDPQDKVVQLYGEPNKSGPSVHGDRELEFLYYAFDWAGSAVPQVMEIQCARDTGRVVEMTLASQVVNTR